MKKKGKSSKASGLKTEVLDSVIKITDPLIKTPRHIDRGLLARVVVIFLLIAVVASWIGIKINFLAKNELSVSILPHQQSISANYDQPIELNFTIKNRNFWFCPTYCELALYDPYYGELLAAENVSLSPNTQINRKYTALLNARGAGQRIYYFEAECNNKRTLLCQTDQKRYLDSSFVAVNYQLPESESKLRDTLKDTLNAYSKMAEIAAGLIDWNEHIAEDIAKQRPEALKIESSGAIVNASIGLLEKSHDLWVKDKYPELSEFLSSSDIELVAGAVTALQLAKDNLLEYADAYNMQATVFNQMQINWAQFSDAYGFYMRINNTSQANSILGVSERIKTAYVMFATDASSQKEEVRDLNASFFNLTFQQAADRTVLENTSVTILNANAGIQAKVFSILGVGEVKLIHEMCADLRNVTGNYDRINADAKSSMQGYAQYENSTEFTALRDAYKRSIIDDNYSVIHENASNQFIINQSTAVNNTLNLTARDYVSVLSFNETSQSHALEAVWCSSANQALQSPFEGAAMTLITLTAFNSSSRNNITFIDNPPRCCIFGQCSDCSVNESLYPTIFVHGHSPMENNPFEESLVAFSKIQRRMGHEALLINAGGIDTSTVALYAGWSRMGVPITLRASYYYIAYYDVGLAAASVRKSESIENYAIRLKELIELVKSNTGASKVNIVAHSMGGLVSREYITLFGEGSVDKLILVGTPNKGISGRSQQFCSTLGSDKECEDMFAGNIFMNRLNSQANVPKSVKVYTIYGTGCGTEGKDGDGLIVADEARLGYAENIRVNGTCRDLLGLSLHNDMLDPAMHPEVYEKIVQILKS